MEDLQLEALEPLDLRRRKTVSEAVEGIEKRSFGARNLGKVHADATMVWPLT